MISVFVLAVLALAAYRTTRFLVVDSLFDGTRSRLHVWLANKKGIIAAKALEGSSCTWCAGVYVSFGAYWLYVWRSPLEWGRYGWLSAVAVAGAQGLIHAFEPDEE